MKLFVGVRLNQNPSNHADVTFTNVQKVQKMYPKVHEAFKGIQQYIFLLFHLEELLKLYVNLFYRFCVTLLFLEILEQKKSQIS
jgi:hypothetical protein